MANSSADIRTVVLSDLHLGEVISILTPLNEQTGEPRPDAAAPVLDALADALRHLIDQNEGDERPTFVFAGDLLGLAYATWPQALAIFERIAGLFFASGRALCDRLVVLPGNHDHHLWEYAREAHFAAQADATEGDEPWPTIMYATPPRLGQGLSAPMLELAAHRALGDSFEGTIELIYPNLALVEGGRCVLIHHGHFAEQAYHFVSTTRRVLLPDRPPIETVEEIESENFAWIDFLWSMVGRSGNAGADIEMLFLILRNEDALNQHASTFARRIAGAVDFPYLPFEWMERVLARTLIRRIGNQASGERYGATSECSPETLAGLKAYLFGPCLAQIRETHGSDPTDLSIIWGHTHKPFEKLSDGPDGRAVAIYNLGGWTVDFPEPHPRRGATIAFLNEALDVAALRLFNDGPDGGELQCRVQYPEGLEAHAFGDAIELRVRDGHHSSAPLAAPWQNLGAVIPEQVLCRRAYLQKPHEV